MIRLPHKTALRLIKRLPLPAALKAYHGYTRAVIAWAPEQLATTYFGARMHCNATDSLQRMVLYFGAWEPDVSRAIEQNLEPGDVFVDVGANIGYDSLLAASRVGSNGRVVAIEASPRTFGLLQENLALNPWAANVRAVHVAVSDRPGTLELYDFGASNIGAATTLASRGGSFVASVDALPLGSILTPEEMRRVRLIKMDVEGAEPTILRELLSNIAEYPATMDIIVEANPEDDYDIFLDVFGRLQESGFTAWVIENRYEAEWYLRWRPTPLTRLDQAPTCRQDLLFTRRSKL